MEVYQQTSEAALAELQTTLNGLSAEEVSRRLEQYGANVIERRRKVSPLKIFLGQFKDFLIIILLIAAAASILLGEHVDGILILIIVVAVAVVGFLNEYKAEKTIEMLRGMVALKTKVRRDGKVVEVETKEVVPGDIVLLEEGQKIPADIRLIEVFSLEVNEAMLTGESQPIFKTTAALGGEAAVADRSNMVFSGTSVTSGKGLGAVVGTAGRTEIGKIATLVEEAEDEATPMQEKLDRLGRQLGYGVLVVCAIVFVVIFFLDKDFASLPFVKKLTAAFIAAVALAVAAIPEGLAFVVRISLALGARRMAKKNALIRKLPAVEALGSTDVICSDKTGTLTKGEMTVREIWTPDQTVTVSGAGYSPEGEFSSEGKSVDPKAVSAVLRAALLCNNARYNPEHQTILGDPTEGALVVAAHKAGLVEEELEARYQRIYEVPFTSKRKMMSTVHTSESGYFIAVKGAVEVILSHASAALVNGTITPMTEELRKTILERNEELSSRALRVLAVGYKETAQFEKTSEAIEADLIFTGLVGMMDPPRPEIKQTVQTITSEAGIRVIMITGDHVETAKAVAAEIGIKGEALTGVELDALSKEAFEKRVENIAVYARVNPEHKIRIVQALKVHGHQVAMTGDGVNDAPAIKAADIGIAMGITGTDVAKETADMVLLDDNFLTIVNAIEEGRGIFDNVRKFVNYLISCNISEVLIVGVGILLFGELAVTAIQLLFINVVTDGLPALALGSDPAEAGIMKRSPRWFQKDIINKRLWLEMFAFGVLMTTGVLVLFGFRFTTNSLEHATAAAFTALVILELVRLIALRSGYRISWFQNPWLTVGLLSSFLLQLGVIYTPFIAAQFGALGVTAGDWTYIAVAGALLFVLTKVIRAALNRFVPDTLLVH